MHVSGDPGFTNLCLSLLPNGTIVWTSPTGHRYRTPQGSRMHFPDWDTTTPVPPTKAAGQSPERGLAMPLRKRTRTAEHTAAYDANANTTKPPSTTTQPRSEVGGAAAAQSPRPEGI